MILPCLAGDRLFLGSSAILLIFDFLRGGGLLGKLGLGGATRRMVSPVPENISRDY